MQKHAGYGFALQSCHSLLEVFMPFVYPGALSRLQSSNRIHSLTCSVGGSRTMSSNLGTEASSSTLFAYPEFMSKCDLVLASQSPRRREIVGLMGLAVSLVGDDVDHGSKRWLFVVFFTPVHLCADESKSWDWSEVSRFWRPSPDVGTLGLPQLRQCAQQTLYVTLI